MLPKYDPTWRTRSLLASDSIQKSSAITLCHCGLWVFWHSLCRIMCSCVWNVSVYRGCTHGHVCAHRARSSLDIYQIRSRPMHDSSIPHSHCLWQERALSVLRTIYSAGVCLCHADVNVYLWWMPADFLQSQKMCTVWDVHIQFCLIPCHYPECKMWDRHLDHGAKFTCFITLCPC